ncbi:DNA replication complex subunit Gins51 [Haloarchaeobius sp. TZWWS8]|uniref:DNA replication complex subunit Gins51 n=1 Tax=Haloarchaeobius sp. TZWWS8 TaxID=3446121 RepID=UPI003EB8C552
MNLGELRSALDTERQKGGLQQLRDSFYQEVAEYVETRKDEREELAAEADDPFASPDVQRITDEIETAKNTAESLYERRLGKLVKQASLAAADMANPDQVQGLTAEERELYEDLVGRIEENKAHMLDVVAGEATTTPAVEGSGDDSAADGDDEPTRADARTEAPPEFDPDPAVDQGPGASDGVSTADAHEETAANTHEETAADPRGDPDISAAEARAIADDEPPASGGQSVASQPADDGVSAADVMGGSPDDSAAADSAAADPTPDEGPTAGSDPGTAGEPSAAQGTTQPDVERTTVRLTQDVGEIFGVDQREYRLTADDVVTLPTANADPLVEREAAEKLE